MNAFGWLTENERAEFMRMAVERQDRMQREAIAKAAETQALVYLPNATGDGATVAAGEVTPLGILAIPEEEKRLTAEDINAAHLDTDAFGRIFHELKLAAALQVLRSIRDDQPTASAVVRGLCAAILERLK